MNDKSSKSGKHDGPSRTSPYPVSRLAPAVELVDLAKQITQADAMVSTRVSAKLQVIADQIKSLQAEAKSVLEEAQQDQQLHHAECNFKRMPGKLYHLYKKNDGTTYFSMLSPEDWGGTAPHEYVNTYRLENDLSWTPSENLGDEDNSAELVRRLLLEKGL